MEKAETEELRERVTCGAVLETGGFAVDLKESTRKAVKYRCGDDITIIVIHDGKLEVEGTEIARRRAGPLLSIKIVLALSVLEHFTAMMLSACGKLKPGT